MTDFAINIIVDPSKSATGNKQVQEHLQKTSEHADHLRESIAHAFEFIGIGFGIRELIHLSDEFTSLQNRLRNVTGSISELTATTEQLFQISNDARQSVEGTSEMFVRLAESTRDAGVSHSDLLSVVDNLSKVMTISGVSAENAGRSMRLLGYGLQQGALSGRELRTLMIQMPLAVEVLAKSMGTTVGNLKKLGDEGKITSDVFLKAFGGVNEEIENKLGKSTITWAQALVEVKNRMVELGGAFQPIVVGFAHGVLNVINDLKNMSSAEQSVLAGLVAMPIAFKAISLFMTGSPFGALAIGATAAVIALTPLLSLLQKIREEEAQRAEGALTRVSELRGLIAQEEKNLEILKFAPNARAKVIESLKLHRAEYESLGGAIHRATVEGQSENQVLAEILKSLDRERALIGLVNGEREIAARMQKETLALEKPGGPAKNQLADAIARVEAQVRMNQAMKESADAMAKFRAPQIAINEEEENFQKLLHAGTLSEQQRTLAIQQHADALRRLQLAVDQADNSISGGFAVGLDEINIKIHDINGTISSGLVSAFDTAEKSLVSFVRTGKFSIKDFANSMLDEIAKVLVKLLELQIMEAITGTGGGGGMLYTAAGGTSATFVARGARAGGGDVDAGKPYLVGEEGPEIFAPAGSGTIVPADRTAAMMGGGGGATNVSVPVQVVNVHSDEEVASRINSAPGAKAIINVLIDNKEAVKRLLA